MTTQQLLPLAPAGAVLIGDATALVTDDDGGRVFIRGELCFVWDAGDDLGRRLAAVQLVRIKAATAMAVATAFGVTTVTLWRWRKELDTSGAQGLAQDKRGPKGPSRLTPEVVADIASRRRGGASLRAIAAAVGVSTFSVRRALTEPTPEPTPEPEAAAEQASEQATRTEEPQPQNQDQAATEGDGDGLPLLPPPADRDAERAAARWGKLTHAEPMFTPRRTGAPGGTPAGDPRPAGHRPVALCCNGVRVPTEGVLRPGHHALRRSPTGPGRGAPRRRRHQDRPAPVGQGTRVGPGPRGQDHPPQDHHTGCHRSGRRAARRDGRRPRGPVGCEQPGSACNARYSNKRALRELGIPEGGSSWEAT
jgi:transposase-like protein